MSKLNTKVLSQNFELIGQRVGSILADELHNQSTLPPVETDINATVWVERFIAFDSSDMPCINVCFTRGNNEGNYVVNSDYTHSYTIDVYTSAKSTSSQRGDVKSTNILHRILGVVRAILENPQYRTLDFASPSIENVSLKTIEIAEADKNKNTESIAMGRIVLDVQVREGMQLQTGVDIAESNTTVKLYNTEKGYKYIIN